MVVVPFPVPPSPDAGNRAAASRLFDHLDRDERLVWADRPDPWSVVRDRGAIVPLWIAAIATPLGAILALASGGGPVYAAGLALLAAAALIGIVAFGIWRRAGETVYGLTDRRVLVLVDGAVPRLQVTTADRIAWIDVVHQRDGSGAVTLTVPGPPGHSREVVLAGLADPKDVARRIAQTYGFEAPHLLQA